MSGTITHPDIMYRIDDTTLGEGEVAVARGNRRRLRVFLMTFLACFLVGLAFVLLQPQEYRAQARISVRTATSVSSLPATAAGSATVTTEVNESGTGSLQAEVGVLTSRPLIEVALQALENQGTTLAEFGQDAVRGVQLALDVEVTSGSNQMSLSLTGTDPAHLAEILNALIQAYGSRVVESYVSTTSRDGDALRHELQELDKRVSTKREALENYRQAGDIVSGEREENQVIARIKGQSTSLNVANEKVAQAEGKLRSLRESLSAGKQVVRARDNPTLASLEARASQLRENLREQERTYTPDFMAMDPNSRAIKSRLADLERQIAEQKSVSGLVALSEAEEELFAARQLQQRLQAQMADDRQSVHAFSRRFNTFKAMQEELAQLEASRRTLAERVLRFETSEKSRMPAVQIVEAATPPREIWRPRYLRDIAFSFGIALACGMLMMGLIELFNRPSPPSNAPVILQSPWIALGHPASPGNVSLEALQPPMLSMGSSPVALPQTLKHRRELTHQELAALLKASSDVDRIWIVLLLCGVSEEEVRKLDLENLDLPSGVISLGDPCPRSIRIPGKISAMLASPEFIHALPDLNEMNRRLLCAAHDAVVDEPAQITTGTLRHTYIAYLVRQGIRFGELGQLVGTLSADELADYAPLSPAGARHSVQDINVLMPALMAFNAG